MALIRVVIATPSMIEQIRLERLLGACQDIEIIAKVDDLSAAYSKVEETIPNVVLVSHMLASVDEYRCMVSLFDAVEATPIVIAGVAAPEEGPATLPRGQMVTTRMTADEIQQVIRAANRAVPRVLPLPPRLSGTGLMGDKVLLIGASTGGIEALSTILSAFPENCPPTAIVQHTGRKYSDTLARLLDNRCAAEVVVAQDGLDMRPGRICLAGGIDGHLQLRMGAKMLCAVTAGPEISGHRPSIDALFLSALPIAHRAIGVLLTGMGRDGALGLQSLRQAGAQTIGQDRDSSVVYGMPRVAFEMGAVETQLPLHQIGPALMQRCALPAQSFQRSL